MPSQQNHKKPTEPGASNAAEFALIAGCGCALLPLVATLGVLLGAYIGQISAGDDGATVGFIAGGLVGGLVGLVLWIAALRKSRHRSAIEAGRRRQEAESQRQVEEARHLEQLASIRREKEEDQRRRHEEHARQVKERKRQDEERRLQDEERRRQDEEAQRRNRIANLTRDAATLPGQLLAEYQRAVGSLASAEKALEVARSHRRGRAYTPFWEAVEYAFSELQNHGSQIGRVHQWMDQYSRTINELTSGDAGADSLGPGLPAGLERISTVSAYESLAKRLEQEVYSAQQDFEFASIYEQRRTTSAIVIGFGSLTRAVSIVGMQVRELTESLSESTNEVRVALARTSGLLSGSAESAPIGSVGRAVLEIERNLDRMARG